MDGLRTILHQFCSIDLAAPAIELPQHIAYMLIGRYYLQFAHRFQQYRCGGLTGVFERDAAGILEGKKAAGITQVIDIVPIMGGTYNGDWSAVIEGRIVTARAPWDIPEFLDAITEAIYRQQDRK